MSTTISRVEHAPRFIQTPLRGSANRTRIAYLIGSLERGGAEGQLLELMARLDRSRWQPSLVLFDDTCAHRAQCLDEPPFSLAIASSGISRSYIKGLKAAMGSLRLARYLRRIRPEILHAFLPGSFVLAGPAVKLARVPVLVGSRRSLSGCYRNCTLTGTADRIATRLCDFVVGNSRAVTDEVVRIDGLGTEKTATIYNGVDTDRFRPGDRSFRRQYGWTGDEVVFGIVANFIPYKRHTDFVQAAALISARHPNARFLMAGEDRGILGRVKQQIVAAGIESRFAIIPGTSEPEKLYGSMDAYVCTSETEGLSNVLLEAAASGLPLVATEVGGNPEIVIPGDNGVLVHVGAPEQIAGVATEWIADPEQRRRMGACSRRIVKRRFSLESMVSQHELMYEQLLAKRRMPRGASE